MHFVAFENGFSISVVFHLEQDFGSDLVVLDSSIDVVHSAKGAAIVLDIASSYDEVGVGLHRQHSRPIIGHGRVEERDGPAAGHAEGEPLHFAQRHQPRRRPRLSAPLHFAQRIGVGVPIAAKDAIVKHGIVLFGQVDGSVEGGARGSDSRIADEAAKASVILEQRIGDVEFGAFFALETDQSAEEAATEQTNAGTDTAHPGAEGKISLFIPLFISLSLCRSI